MDEVDTSITNLQESVQKIPQLPVGIQTSQLGNGTTATFDVSKNSAYLIICTHPYENIFGMYIVHGTFTAGSPVSVIQACSRISVINKTSIDALQVTANDSIFVTVFGI